ncbi:MAG TPA: DUF5000 domain-containing lipoprotein [Pedobacter sp.]|uniref:DUF5000 domain-containing lipoprotein n=1 Tax=Pedobacter sp. TaxID=1411316 RepID=UPI002B576D8C|nr:DUF5000 domain-containing lipoprotein [Pedobacter sp.]HMI02904.1 DUF5000 domain-containing lipoprotein [Pedobacter sp.]
MKKILYFVIICLLVTIGYGCSKEERVGLIADPNAPAPSPVTNVKVESKPGGAILTYRVPADPNLSYVKAVYEIQPGISREAKSSIFTDTLSLVGYGDTSMHEVKIYSVGKNEKASEPLAVQFRPESPPILSSFEKLAMIPTFGGVNVSVENSNQANLTIVVIVDSTGRGTWAPVNTFYSSSLKAKFSARGFLPDEKKFGVYLKDRWNNKSDTLIKVLTPLYEELITKNTFKEVKLPTDTYLFVETFSMPKVWDDKFSYNIFATPHTSKIPQWFTFDMGKKVVLSRFKEFQYHESPYTGASVKSFEVWGSDNPNLDGSWTNWTLLGTFESFKPSGKPYGTTTADDVNYAITKGEDFEFTDPLPPVRYIRFKTTATWGGTAQVVITELTFWGQLAP